MKRDMPFKVPILLDEIYLFNHKTGNMSTAKAYVDVANNTAYHILSVADKRGNIRTAKLNFNPKVFKDRKRTRGDRRTTRVRDKVSHQWFDEIQSKLNVAEPIQVFTWNRNREKVRVIASLNRTDTSEIFIRVGDEVSAIVKEKNTANWIQGLIIAGIYAYAEEYLMDMAQDAFDAVGEALDISIEIYIEFSIDETGISIIVDIKVEYGGYGD